MIDLAWLDQIKTFVSEIIIFIPQIIIFLILMLWNIIEILIFITQIIVFLKLIPSIIIKIIIFMVFGLFALVQGKTRTPRGVGASLPLPWAGVRSASPCGDTWHVGYLSWRWGWLSLPWAWAKPAPPLGDTWRLGCLPLHWVRPKYHVALKLACPCPRRELTCAPIWGHLASGLLALAMG